MIKGFGIHKVGDKIIHLQDLVIDLLDPDVLSVDVLHRDGDVLLVGVPLLLAHRVQPELPVRAPGHLVTDLRYTGYNHRI